MSVHPRKVSPCRPTLLGLAAVLLASLLAPATASAEEVRREEQSYYAGDATRVEIHLSFGSLQVYGTDDRNAEVEFVITCRRQDRAKCDRRAERILLQARLHGDTLHLELKNTPRGQIQGLDAHMKVWIPRRHGLEIDVSGGDIRVEGMRSHLEIDSAGGQVEVLFPQDEAKYVKVDVGFGEADLWTRDGSRIEGAGFPKGINWRGTGHAEVEIDLGGGEADIRLE